VSGGGAVDAQVGPPLGGRGLVAAARAHRRILLGAAGVGLAGLALASALGHPVAGALLCVGLGLGAWNSFRAQSSLAGFAAGDVGRARRLIAMSVLRRLAVVSAVAIGLAVLFRPDGWTVVVGIAAFQALMIGGTARPLLREIRRG
jgi:hypothetical protein